MMWFVFLLLRWVVLLFEEFSHPSNPHPFGGE